MSAGQPRTGPLQRGDSRSLDRAFPFGDDDALCFACAVGRGGKYDERGRPLVEPPNLSGFDEFH